MATYEAAAFATPHPLTLTLSPKGERGQNQTNLLPPRLCAGNFRRIIFS